MNDASIEKIFSLEEIDYARFWGQNDRLLDFVRLLFPKLKLIVRGDMLKAVGADEDIAWFEGKLQTPVCSYSGCLCPMMRFSWSFRPCPFPGCLPDGYHSLRM